ncbi:hypothetical protein Tco_1192348 [Tanacetum coccineum]
MFSITDQQTKLDLELVPKEKRLEIGKCNERLNPGKKKREPTFQVVLDDLALTPCYYAFLTTIDILEVYMHQLWDTIHKSVLEFMVKTLMNFPLMKILCLSSKNLVILGKSSQSLMLLLIRCINLGELLPLSSIEVYLERKTLETLPLNACNKVLIYKVQHGVTQLRLSRGIKSSWGMYYKKMYYKKNVDYVELLWEDFTYQIDNRGHKKQDKMYYARFTKVIIHHFLTKDKTISKRNKIGMHTSRDDYLINTLRFVSARKNLKFMELDFLISPEEPTRKSKRVKRPAKKSTNAPTTGVVIRETPVMSLSKKKEKMTIKKRKGIDLLSKVALTEEAQYEEVCKKSLRDFHKTHPSGSGTVTKIAPSAAKIKPSVTNERTGVKPGVLNVTEEESTKSEAESWGRDEDDSNNDHDSRSEGNDQESDIGNENTQFDKEKGSDSKHETDENEMGSESDQEENEDDEEEKNDEFVKTPSISTDDEDDESKVEDKVEGDKDKGMDYTTNQFEDDVNVRPNEPVDTDEGFLQKEGTDAKMINVQQGNENPEISINQVIEDAHVIIFIVPKKTKVQVTSSSHSSDLASKFLIFLDIPHTDAEIVSLMDVHVHHEVPSNQTPTLITVLVLVITESSLRYITVIPQSLPSFAPPPPQSTPTPPPTTEAINPLSELPNFASVFQFNNRVTTLEKEVAELKKDEHLDSRLGATRDEFMNYLSASIIARITEQIKSIVTESLKHAVLAKESSQQKLTYEAAGSLIEFKLKNILIDKMDESQSYLTVTEHRECYDGLIKSYDLDKSESKSGLSKGTKSQSTSFGKSVHAEEPEFEVANSDMPQDQEENFGNDDEEPKGKVVSKRDWFTKPKRPQEPIDPDWNVGKTPQQGPTQS